MKLAFFVLALWCVAWSATTAQAHELRPAYLEIRELDDATFDVLWKVPGRGDLRLALYVRFPPSCTALQEPVVYAAGDAFIERWKVKCPDGLVGETIGIDGLSTTMTDVLVRLNWAQGATETTRLDAAKTEFVVAGAPSWYELAWAYTLMGVEHILLGIDHLLFVLGLLLIVPNRWALLKTITAFTVAHSITLALAVLGVVNVPPQPVDAAIALSIVFLGVEIIHCRRGTARTYRPLHLGGLVWFWITARLGVCRRPHWPRAARIRHPDRPIVFQCGRGGWSADVRCIFLGIGVGFSDAGSAVAEMEQAHSRLLDWHRRDVLVHRTFPHYSSGVITREMTAKIGKYRAWLRPQAIAGTMVGFAILSSHVAEAHEAHAADGFISGLTHPLYGLDHVIAMVAVGLWGGQLKKPAIWLLPVTFPVVMAIGGMFGSRGIPLPYVEVGIAASAIVLGIMIAASLKPPLWVAALIVGAFAVFHGHAHGTELPEAAAPLSYSVGFVVSTGLLHLIGIAFGLLVDWEWGEKVVRAGGGVIACIGIFFLVSAVG